MYLYFTTFPCILLTRHYHILSLLCFYFETNLLTSMPRLICIKDKTLGEEIKYWKSGLQVFLSVGDVEWIFKRDSRINESPPKRKEKSVTLSPLCSPKRDGLTLVQNSRCEKRLRRWKLRLLSEAWSKNWWYEDAFDVSNVKHDDVRTDKWWRGITADSLWR